MCNGEMRKPEYRSAQAKGIKAFLVSLGFCG